MYRKQVNERMYLSMMSMSINVMIHLISSETEICFTDLLDDNNF